jgi:hypothetical protein
MCHAMLKRITILGLLLLAPLTARAQNNFPTAGGAQVEGVVAMCLDGNGNAVPQTLAGQCGSGGGAGTVTTFSVVTANGVSASVANPTTTPAATFTLGAITPSSVAIGAGSAITSSGPGGAMTSAAYTTLGANVATALGQALNGSGALSATTSPVFVTPSLGVATATSIAIGGCTIGTDVLCTTGTTTLNGATVVSGASFGLSGNISAPAWTTAGVRYKNVTATLTDTTSSGTVAAARTDNFGGNTIAAASATTYTNYTSAYFSDPVAGANVTFTNKWSLGVDSIKIAGVATPSLQIGSGTGGDSSSAALLYSSGNSTGIWQTFASANASLEMQFGVDSSAGFFTTLTSLPIDIRPGNSFRYRFQPTTLGIGSGTAVSWNSSSTFSSTSLDTGLSRDGPGVIDVGTGVQGSKAGSMNLTNLTGSGNIMVGSATPLTLSAGEVGMAKITASGAAPGAAGLKFEAVCGTGAGTLKIIAYAGTSATPVTIVDNVGASATGC